MAATKITSRVLADDAVVRATLGDDAIGTAEIADDAITSALVADDIALGGNPTTTTQSTSNSSTRLATTAFVQAAVDADINALIDSAPGTMNTLDEIAAALNDDPTFTTTVNNAIALKAPIANPVFTGNATFDSPTLYVDSENNRVGIGDTTPSYTLDVAGTLRATGTITGDITGAVTGNASTATALATARTIGGTSFDGTANIVPGTATALATGRTIGMTGDVVWTSPSFDGSGNVTAAGTIQTDAVDIAMLSASGTASSSTFLRGDNSWTAVSTPITALNNATANELVTVGSTTTELDSESGLTFDGTTLGLNATGDIGIHIRADTDNSGEGDNPFLSFGQDGSSAKQFYMGLEGTAGTQATGTLSNAAFIRANNDASQPLQIAHMDSVVATFRSGSVGIGTASPADKLHVVGDIRISGGNQMTNEIAWFNSSHYLAGIRQASHGSYNDSGGLQFLTSGTSNAAESVKMVIDTQGKVGIGDTAPEELLTMVAASGDCNIRMEGSAVRIKKSGSDWLSYDGANLKLSTGNNERMRITAGGFVGIGVTPESNWASDVKVLQVGGLGGFWGKSSQAASSAVNLSYNVYDHSSTGQAAIVTDEASMYQQDDGEHKFVVASSTSADAAISWKQPMTIKNDGSIVIDNVATSSTGAGIIAHHTNNNMYIRGGTESLNLGGGSASEGSRGFVNIPEGNNNLDLGISGTTRFRVRHDGTTFMGPNTAGQIHVSYSSSYVTMADDATITLSGVANTGCLISIGSYRKNGQNVAYAHGLIFLGYNIGTAAGTIVADPIGFLRNSDTDGYICVYKTAGGGNVTVKNRLGISNNVSITIHRYLGN